MYLNSVHVRLIALAKRDASYIPKSDWNTSQQSTHPFIVIDQYLESEVFSQPYTAT